MEAYNAYVSFVPTAKHMEVLELDATRMHPTLLRDSIRAAVATGAGLRKGPEDQRRIIHTIYTRKVKEMAALWPFIFSVENAYRALLTEHFHTKFGSRDWWRSAEAAILSGRAVSTSLHGATITATLARTIERVVGGMMSNNDLYPTLRLPANVTRFFYFLSLGQLSFFIDDDWEGLSKEFTSNLVKGQKVTKRLILENFAVVRDVRNELYHSNPIRNSQIFIRSVETLLLSADVNPGRFDESLRQSIYDRPVFTDLKSGQIPPR
jgi:hypothetical protein